MPKMKQIDKITNEEIKTFSSWVQSLIEQSGLTRIDFAIKMGVHIRTVDNWCSPTSTHKPRYGSALTLLKRFEKELNERK